ncbi:biotin--[acetyl-CoA-carboxylase] ligase [Desulfofustis glycolicus]|uniref:BirA family transcriptional regulator, biotin operon repressor / biotin-[acetyl-CoA-carboxylase] ligase n=1 Tax=Desulfofustis glycolicus DSM 9705 TaxID=1121409 RepID=A0A1M5UHL6_9BACT|nr:biotin--[acetyl-CoA-carboxylase] ligase [Desulfofustis glycolicus]MCB2217485.1 biotin--[acetyl-CoA-carboxylase] ligase [Desulfobulbaceae bacterium]SHH62467.1 BirA family transcriptional regulator, biotin operon repressor / biotin-[acetyl-CoA-carboxylase] ligase [Desulfofustis glycolicus DSM 9705]
MTSTVGLTAARLRSYCRDVELPARRSGPLGRAADEIMRYGAFVGSVIERHKRLERAMLLAREQIAVRERAGESVVSGTTIIADSLTGSRGRFARSWHAPPGGLWGTLVVVNTLLPPSFRLLPMVAGIACCEAVRDYCPAATVRWINDVLIGGRKVGGFLCESFIGEGSGEEFCLIGFGINVNNESFPEELRDDATSLSLAAGTAVDLSEFGCRFLAALTFNIGLLYYHEDHVLGQRIDAGAAHPLLLRWRELSDSLGRSVVYGFDVISRPQYRAVVTGIDNEGGLCLTLTDGSRIVEHSGEIRYLM